jgi:transposase
LIGEHPSYAGPVSSATGRIRAPRWRTARRRARRDALPAHLPRVEVMLTPEDTACPCCRAAMTVIGEDVSERLDLAR